MMLLTLVVLMYGLVFFMLTTGTRGLKKPSFLYPIVTIFSFSIDTLSKLKPNLFTWAAIDKCSFENE